MGRIPGNLHFARNAFEARLARARRQFQPDHFERAAFYLEPD